MFLLDKCDDIRGFCVCDEKKNNVFSPVFFFLDPVTFLCLFLLLS